MRNLIKKILRESEDDFGWVEDITPTNFDYAPGVVYRKFGGNEEVKKYVIKKIIDTQFSDVKLVGNKVILETDGFCDFTNLFYHSNRGSDGYVDQYLAEKLFCDEDDWWEPYYVSDLVPKREWKKIIWEDLVVENEKVLNLVLHNIKLKYTSKVNYNPNQLDIFGELPTKQNVVTIRGRILDDDYFYELKNDLDRLGDLIDREGEFKDLKNELTWAYGDAYNTAARDEVWIAAKKAVTDIVGEGKWEQKQVQKPGGTSVTKHYMEFDITNTFWEYITWFYDNCYDNCLNRRSFEDMSMEELEEQCEDCNYPDYNHFTEFMAYVLDEQNETLNPRFDEYPDDSDVEKYFVESIMDRI